MDAENEEWQKPIRSSEFEVLSEVAYTYLREQQKVVESQYGIHQYESWHYDQETGLLTFSNEGKELVRIVYEEVGSISKITETWLWSWANPNLEDKIKTDILMVKQYGEANSLEPLTKRKWYNDDYDGWELTAIAAYLMKAKGAYRVPLENTFSFMIYKTIEDVRP